MVEQKLFKWIGGKKWLSSDLNQIFKNALSSNNVDTYIEPFAGGLGSFLFTLDTLKDGGIKNVILNDINSNIINLYSQIQKNPKPLFNLYWKLESDYQKTIPAVAKSLHHIKNKEELRPHLSDARSFFENVRSDYNSIQDKENIQKAVMFLFIVKHSFNGIYRENNKGFCNSPFNWQQGLFDKAKVLNAFNVYNKIFNEFNIKFYNKDVFTFIEENKNKSNHSLFYFDPPYLNESSNENQYNKDHFTLEHQKQLLNEYSQLKQVVFSNHYIDIFKDFCQQEGFEYQEILRNNIMSPKSKDEKSKISEILAAKY